MSRWYDPLLSKEHQLRGKKKNKFKAVRTNCGKHWHMSGAESDCCLFFQILEKSGELEILCVQPNVLVTKAKLKIIPDWLLRYKDGRTVYADYKGKETDSWGRNRRLWKYYGPLPMEVWKQKASGFFISETIFPHE